MTDEPTNADPDSKTNPAAQAAALIQSHLTEIMEQWLAAVREHIPASSHQGQSELADHLLELLNDITRALERLQGEEDTSKVGLMNFISASSGRHGRERATVDHFRVGDLVHEYILLRHIVTGYCHAKLPDHRRTSDIINRVIESASLAAVNEFARAVQEVQQKLVGTLVHDVRTPLGVAFNSVELLSSGVLNADQREQVMPTISRNLKRAVAMLEGFLDMTKAGAGSGLLMTFEEADLAGAIRTLCQEANLIYEGEIDCRLPENPVNGVFDMSMVVRTVENLVSNAVKFGRVGTPIGISLQDEGDSVSIRVHNEGEPISPGHQKEIFNTFSSPSERSGGRRGGWGLGLSLIKTVARNHGGNVILESSREEGTTLGMTLQKRYRKDGEELIALL